MRISDWSSDVCSSDLLAEGRRVPIATPALSGSINLVGARIDDVTLTNYRQTIDKDSPPARLFAPAGTSPAYFASLGWRSEARRVGKECVSTCRSRWSP